MGTRPSACLVWVGPGELEGDSALLPSSSRDSTLEIYQFCSASSACSCCPSVGFDCSLSCCQFCNPCCDSAVFVANTGVSLSNSSCQAEANGPELQVEWSPDSFMAKTGSRVGAGLARPVSRSWGV